MPSAPRAAPASWPVSGAACRVVWSSAAAACRLEQSVSAAHAVPSVKRRAEQHNSTQAMPGGGAPLGLAGVWLREEMGLGCGRVCGNERSSARSSSLRSNPM
ncbi:unnamed protein product [Urochloa humidicola]